MLRTHKTDVHLKINPAVAKQVNAPSGGAYPNAGPVSPHVVSAVPGVHQANGNWFLGGVTGAGVNSTMSFGIAMDGNYRAGQPMIFEYAGQFITYDNVNVALLVFFARMDNPTVTIDLTSNDPNLCSDPFLLPFDMEKRDGVQYAAWNLKLCIGDFQVADYKQYNPFIFGFGMRTIGDYTGVVEAAISVTRESQGTKHFEIGA